ncbi:MAG: hypothetical protein ACTHJW_21945 [Streptosporangiaceae bacterium]
MSGGSTASTASTASAAGTGDMSQKWAALAKHNERLVDPSHPLLAELRRDHPDIGRNLPAAS